MLTQYGPCAKIAYVNDQPVANIMFYPETSIPYLNNPRTDVVYLKCIYNVSRDAQRQGIGTALIQSFIDETSTGLQCIGGRPCQFIVTRPFPHEGDLPLSDFYEKYGFKEGRHEMFLEVTGTYEPLDIPDYRSRPEDRDKVIITFNPECEWGYFFATGAHALIRRKYPALPIEVYNNWENPEVYKSNPHFPLIAGSIIINAQVHKNPFTFWVDRSTFLRIVDEALQQ
jgi:GNAT superfamily N-acetyltransferase